MVSELMRIEALLLETLELRVSDLVEEAEAKEYFGCSFMLGKHHFKFRKSKITPKKVGQFVTLWKRNSNKETEPFSETDDVDFVVILVEELENYGFFLFPKSELVKRKILSTHTKGGKRGFRVYSKWTQVANKQAEKSQIWQTRYFIDFTLENVGANKRLAEIMAL